MGQQVWESTRLDRLSGSRIWTTANTPTLSTLSGLQLVKLGRDSCPPVSPCLTNFQDVALLLSSVFRISPRDTYETISWLHNQRWHYPEYLPIPQHNALLTTAATFLNFFTNYNLWKDIIGLFNSWTNENWDKATILNEMYYGTWLVIFLYYKTNGGATTASCGRSYFIDFGGLPASEQVHIIDMRTARLRSCYLLISRRYQMAANRCQSEARPAPVGFWERRRSSCYATYLTTGYAHTWRSGLAK
ncbi:hypothetical protein F4819DRAFT_75204 [Hypoxylon fuscum]|nr:hypothetical protein F4819DRAFT_75204 [Hypoxylon fuscum]